MARIVEENMGKLSIHEEFPDRVAPIVGRFLASI
jgi:hypothetical protein